MLQGCRLKSLFLFIGKNISFKVTRTKTEQTYKDEFHLQSFPADDEYHILFRNAPSISQVINIK